MISQLQTKSNQATNLNSWISGWTFIVSQRFARWEHLPLRSRNGTRRDRRLGDGSTVRRFDDGFHGRFHGEPEATWWLSTRNFRFPTFVCWIQPCNIVKPLACFPWQTSGCLKLGCSPFCLMVKIREFPIRIAYAMVSIELFHHFQIAW